jgi:hypothetical protein
MTKRPIAAAVPLILFSLIGVLAAQDAESPDYDLVLRGGKIVDGTGNPWFYGDVAVRGDRIVAVRRVLEGKGKREIDVAGLIVAPGFIDMHSHSDFLLLEDGHAQSKIRQGVTTEVLGEGNSAGPHRDHWACAKNQDEERSHDRAAADAGEADEDADDESRGREGEVHAIETPSIPRAHAGLTPRGTGEVARPAGPTAALMSLRGHHEEHEEHEFVRPLLGLGPPRINDQ